MPPDTKSIPLTRRQFVVAGAIGSAAALIGCKTGREGNWEFFSEDESQTLTVLCDQIIPADDYPSASQAGVLTYIDRQLKRHYRRHQPAYREGLAHTETLSTTHFGQLPAVLTPPQQLELVTALAQQDPAFFSLVRTHTMEGYYGSPRHGGNRDAVSWRMLGLGAPPVLGRSQYDLEKGSAS
jgi:gluconate 2-dehydrogenase gamma chain